MSRPGRTEKRRSPEETTLPSRKVSIRKLAQVPGAGNFSAKICHWPRSGASPARRSNRGARLRMAQILAFSPLLASLERAGPPFPLTPCVAPFGVALFAMKTKAQSTTSPRSAEGRVRMPAIITILGR
ncbi:MAG: hypothetical protein EBS68_16765 [Rhodobacteraceae bacterium]|nr:hypothetical protein [Paracoccaceae bacterium]